jgi:hypothetical protein
MRVLRLCSVLLVLLVAQTALGWINTVHKQVDCDKGDSITAAAADLNADKTYVLHVSGVCNENVVVENFEGITLTILGDPSATIQGFTVVPAGPPVVSVSNSRRVVLANLTIITSGGMTSIDNPAGVALNLCRGCEVSNSVINTSRVGINLSNSQVSIAGITINSSPTATNAVSVLDDSNATVSNLTANGSGGGIGLLVDRSSRVRMNVVAPGSSSIQNYSVGMQVRNASTLEAGAPCNPVNCLEVHNNSVTGIQIISAQATLIGVNVTNNNQGIVVQNSGTLSYAGPGSITGSSPGPGGVGVLVTHNSHAAIFGNNSGSGTNITGNSGRGVAVASNSSVQFLGLSGGMTNITGNNGAFNIACDTSSLITGTANLGATTISCADQQTLPVVIP